MRDVSINFALVSCHANHSKKEKPTFSNLLKWTHLGIARHNEREQKRSRWPLSLANFYRIILGDFWYIWVASKPSKYCYYPYYLRQPSQGPTEHYRTKVVSVPWLYLCSKEKMGTKWLNFFQSQLLFLSIQMSRSVHITCECPWRPKDGVGLWAVVSCQAWVLGSSEGAACAFSHKAISPALPSQSWSGQSKIFDC